MVIICIALEKELPAVFKNTNPEKWCRIQSLMSGAIDQYKNQPFLVIVTGVGECEELKWVFDYLNPTEVVNFGTAGSSTLPLGAWCHLTTVSNGYSSFELSPQTVLPIPYSKFHLGSGFTVDGFDSSIEADVIDMETYYLAEVCKELNIPFVSFKFITDKNNELTQTSFNQTLSDFNASFNQFLNYLILEPITIAVVIPVFNRHSQLKLAINSVLNQSYKPTEVIIVDDGSDPPIDGFDDRVNVIRINANKGVSNARNVGISYSKSNWIALLDSDDIWHKDHLQELVDYLNQNPLCRFLQTDETWVRNGKHFNKKAYHQKPSGWALEPSLERCLVSPSAVMMHRQLLDLYGMFDSKLSVCEDYDLWLRLLRYVSVGLVNKVTMTKYGGHCDQLSEVYPAMDRFRLQSLIKAYNNERLIGFKQLFSSQLLKKIAVLKNGANKRQQTADVLYYDSLINQINNGDVQLIARDIESVI